MPYREDYADLWRAALRDLPGVSEKKMFGGLCILLRGNMLCGVHGEGAMARVGKDREPAALAYEGVAPLSLTGRPMGGIVELDERAMENPAIREAVLQLALQFVGSLPPKKAGATKRPRSA